MFTIVNVKDWTILIRGDNFIDNLFDYTLIILLMITSLNKYYCFSFKNISLDYGFFNNDLHFFFYLPPSTFFISRQINRSKYSLYTIINNTNELIFFKAMIQI